MAEIAVINEIGKIEKEIAEEYRKYRQSVRHLENRRNELCDGLNRIGWDVTKPLATMFVWAKIPKKFNDLGSLDFSKLLIKHAKVAVSPGAGFGEDGDSYVRFSLIENEHRTRQAVRGIRNFLNGK